MIPTMVAKKKYIHSKEPATKGDLEQLREDLQIDITNSVQASEKRLDGKIDRLDNKVDSTKEELKTYIDSKAEEISAKTQELLKDEMDKRTQEILHHFDAAVEIIHNDLAGANQDEISFLKDKTKQHDHDIAALQKRVGIR